MDVWYKSAGNIFILMLFYIHFISFYLCFKLILYHFTELLQKYIFQIPTKCVGYDWTFNIGSSIYDKFDCNTLLSENNNKIFEQDMKENDEEQKYCNKLRKRSSKLPTSWLITTNDKEFILTITITPGNRFIIILLSFHIHFILILHTFYTHITIILNVNIKIK